LSKQIKLTMRVYINIFQQVIFDEI